MDKTQTIEDFYRFKLGWMPDDLKKEIGHFNVFEIADFVGPRAKPIPYNRKDYYKISLIIGRNVYHYADKSIEIEKNALLFANPQVPYNWEPLDQKQSGFFCIFTEAFFREFINVNLQHYPVFKPGGQPIFFLPDEQVATTADIFRKMFEDIKSDYVYKYDSIRTRVFELIHSAQRMQPAARLYSNSNAATRISSLFMELLERQFPIESPHQQINFRSAREYADQLAVHVNHLNRALKETTNKTTSELIAERLIQEAVTLLKHTSWNVSEIAHTLGFEEPTHFNNFFKKRTRQTPTTYRIV
jgi:AraC family transcriptional regulator, transcriptional activator of pobA